MALKPRTKNLLEKMRKRSADVQARYARPWVHSPRQRDAGCSLASYEPRMDAGTTHDAPNLSPSLKGCYADPIEWALEVHGEKLPLRLDDPGAFSSTHVYENPKDPDAWPKRVKVITLCRNGHVRSF